jgi:hypothetical protein
LLILEVLEPAFIYNVNSCKRMIWSKITFQSKGMIFGQGQAGQGKSSCKAGATAVARLGL